MHRVTLGFPKGEELVHKGMALFDEFYAATRAYREKCERNEQYWRANHWQGQGKRDEDEPQPVTPVLFSTLEAMLADMMDNYPEAVLLGEEASDDSLAQDLTQVVRYVLSRRQYRGVYRKKCRQVLKMGTAVQEVFWDDTLYGGLGDVGIRAWDIRHFLWDPKFEQLQDGRAVFKFGFYPKEWFLAKYPHKAVSGGGRYAPTRLANEVDIGSGDIMLVEMWWKEEGEKGPCIHMAKMAGGVLLEDSRDVRPQGMYAHGKYPFIVEALYPLDSQPVGLGMIDILQNLQHYADTMDQLIMKNALMSGKFKMLVNKNADLDEGALIDWDTEVVRAARIDEGAVRFMQAAPISPMVLAHQQSKLQAIKEESGQTSFNRGEGGGGITAASAILALQEAGNKRSRMINEQMHDGFEEMVRMIIAVMMENYSEKRKFRIVGEGMDEMVVYEPADAVEFDINIKVQKQTPYRTLYQNELAFQLLAAGIVDAAGAVEMMSFSGKDRVLSEMRAKQEQGLMGGFDAR